MECACRTCDKHGQDVNCHATCEEYKEYERKRKELRDKRYKAKMGLLMLEDAKRNRRFWKGER